MRVVSLLSSRFGERTAETDSARDGLSNRRRKAAEMRFWVGCRTELAAWCRAVRKVARTHRGVFHLSVIGFIGWDLMHTAAGMADWGFVLLALLFEVDGEA